MTREPVHDKGPPLQLGYSAHAAKSSWPVRAYLVAVFWAFITMYGYVAGSIPYKYEQIAHWRIQFALLSCAGVRLAWARFRREQGRGWIFYVVLLALAPFLWVAGVSCLKANGVIR